MRRKKSPILLISLVCLAGTGLLVMSQQWNFYNKSPEDQMKELQRQAAERASAEGPGSSPQGTPPADALAQQAKEKLKSAGSKEPIPEDMSPGSRQSKAPSVVMPETPVTPKPTKNESSIEGQWWR